jgi:hypothetical protein
MRECDLDPQIDLKREDARHYVEELTDGKLLQEVKEKCPLFWSKLICECEDRLIEHIVEDQ